MTGPRMRYRIERPNASVGTPPLEALLAAIPDDRLELLWSLQTLIGERKAWPGWAIDVLSEKAVDPDTRLEFVRVLERAWPSARHETRAALGRVAKRFRVALPDDRRSTSAPMRRLRPSPVASPEQLEVPALKSNDARSRSNGGSA